MEKPAAKPRDTNAFGEISAVKETSSRLPYLDAASYSLFCYEVPLFRETGTRPPFERISSIALGPVHTFRATAPGGNFFEFEVGNTLDANRRTTMPTQSKSRKQNQDRNPERELRKQLAAFLRGGHAHVDLATAIKDFPARFYGAKPPGSPHSAWELLEHMRIALHDLLEFSTSPKYREPNWPDDYWPSTSAPPSPTAWRASVRAIRNDLKAFEALVNNPKNQLEAEIPWGKNGQTLLREVLLVIDHNSYHLGELVLLRQSLGIWKS
jgi:hypothetical protein